MVFRITGILLSVLWLFLAFLAQMVFAGGNYAPDISSVSKIIGVFLLIATPAIIYLSKLLHTSFLRSKISIILVFTLLILIFGLLRGVYIVNSNIRIGGNPIAIASVNNKTYVFDKGNQIYCGGNDPSCFKTVNPVVWIIDNKSSQLIEKLGIPDKEFPRHINPNEFYPKANLFQDKLYFPYDKRILIIDSEDDSVQLIDIDTITSKPLLLNLIVRGSYIDSSNRLLYLLLAPSSYGKAEEPTILEAVNLENLTETLHSKVESEFVLDDFTLPQTKSIFVGNDGLIRIVTAPRHQPNNYEFVLTTIDSSGNTLDEFNTNIKAGRAPTFIDEINSRLFMPSGNLYLAFDLINKVTGDFASEKAISMNIRSNIESTYPLMAIGDKNLYFLFGFEKETKISVVDKDKLTPVNSFKTNQEFTRFDSVIGGTNGNVYIAKKNELYIYDLQGKLIRKISLK